MLYSEPGIGSVKLSATKSDLNVEWVSCHNSVKSEVKHAVWSKLCLDPDLEMQRLATGLFASEILQTQGKKVMESIGHPIDAFKESRPYQGAVVYIEK